ncbi:MAG: thiamine biosynthesis protein ThiC, partial [Planctomycetota bacterium]
HDEDLDVDTDFCAMCGHDWCSVRISKEIQEFASGKADGFTREKVVRSDALTPEQKAILEQRGYLKPEEIHKLAAKGTAKSESDGGESDKLACHSDYVDADEAKEVQRDRIGRDVSGEKLVQLNTAPAHNLASDDRLI